MSQKIQLETRASREVYDTSQLSELGRDVLPRMSSSRLGILPSYDTFDFIRFLPNLSQMTLPNIQIQANQYIRKITSAETCFHAFPTSTKMLRVDVIDMTNLDQPIDIPNFQTSDKQAIYTESLDPSVLERLQKLSVSQFKTFVAVPVFRKGQPKRLGFYICLINKTPSFGERFNFSLPPIEFLKEDELFVKALYKSLGLILTRAVDEGNTKFLEQVIKIVRYISRCKNNYKLILKHVLVEARDIMRAETVFLFERKPCKKLLVNNFSIKAGKETCKYSMLTESEDDLLREMLLYPKLLVTRLPVNCRHAQIDVRNLICLPLKNFNNKILGIVEFCNKVDGGFNRLDRDLARTAVTFCRYVMASNCLVANHE